MNRKMLVYLCCVFVLAALGGVAAAYLTQPGATPPPVVRSGAGNTQTRMSSSSPASREPTATPTNAPTPTVGSQPPARPTVKPTTKPTPVPTKKPTPTTGPTYHNCTIASCPNPWGYHLQAGINGPGITVAPSGFCDWFLCADTFASGSGGMIVACNNNAFDWTQSYYANRCASDGGIRGYLTS